MYKKKERRFICMNKLYMCTNQRFVDQILRKYIKNIGLFLTIEAKMDKILFFI